MDFNVAGFSLLSKHLVYFDQKEPEVAPLSDMNLIIAEKKIHMTSNKD